MENENTKVHWMIDSEEEKKYQITTYFRCMKIEEFINTIEKENKIVGLIFEGNNIGFILDPK